MALRTSNGTGGGNWSVAGTWDTGVPVDSDTFLILAGDTVVFDVDQSGFANGMGASTIQATGVLNIKDDAGTYYLKMNGDLTLTGTLQAGTSAVVPFTGTFTVDFNSGSNSIVISDATGSLLLYCAEPTTKYVSLTAQEPAAETVMAVDTDISSDWSNGDTVVICDLKTPASSTHDNETDTIAGMTATTITLTGGLANQKEIGTIIGLVTRNIRLIDSTDYAIKEGATGTNEIYAEINSCSGGGIQNTQNATIGGCIIFISASGKYAALNADSSTFDAGLFDASNNNNYGIRGANMVTSAGSIIAGMYFAGLYLTNCTINGVTAACGYGLGTRIRGTTINGDIIGCRYTIASAYPINVSGDIYNCDRCFDSCSGMVVSNCELGKSKGGVTSTRVMTDCIDGRFFNCLFTSTTEFTNYNLKTSRPQWGYVESNDHDQVTNAYKAWCLGGIVTSNETSPPTGYDRWYEHACEYMAGGSFPCFRQFETVVQSGEAIEVTGVIRIADGEDLTTDPPALQIIDKFADPLVDSTQTPLAEDEVPEPDGGVEADWQGVSVIWANAGDSPRTVIVRMYASVAGVAAAVDVDEAWAIASYKTQIAEILKKVKRLGPTGEV